jgi:hypothetical protein
VNPWSRAETGDQEAEARDRELFARRARELGPGEVPSLAAVLRASRAREAEEAQRARTQGLVAVLVAAACIALAIGTMPRFGVGARSPESIGADLDAGHRSAATLAATAPVEPAQEETCLNAASGVLTPETLMSPRTTEQPKPVAASTEPPACFAAVAAASPPEPAGIAWCAAEQSCAGASP